MRRHDLAIDSLAPTGFDLAWCRWLAMVLPALDPLLDLLSRRLRPGGRFVAHEDLHWETFGLYPHGVAIARFAEAVLASFPAAAGDPNVNRRRPALLAERGFRVDALRPLPVLGRAGDPWASGWNGSCASMAPNRWHRTDPSGPLVREAGRPAEVEMGAARSASGSCWVGPTVLESRPAPHSELLNR